MEITVSKKTEEQIFIRFVAENEIDINIINRLKIISEAHGASISFFKGTRRTTEATIAVPIVKTMP
jgi:hypothetical protein